MSITKGIQFHTETKYLNIDQISKNTWNPNYVSEDMMRAIKDDIQKHGFIGSIIVQKFNTENKEKNVIINGEHRYDALVQLGAKGVPCHILDVPDKVARLLTLRLNREHGDLMPDKVATLLESLDEDLDIDTLAEMTAMPVQELELLTELDISDVAEKKDDVIPESDVGQGKGQEKEVNEVFEQDEKTKALTLTWSNVEALVKQLAQSIKERKHKYGVILAITRGGVIPARLLQRELGIKEMRLLPVDKKKFVIDTGATKMAMQESREEGSKSFLVVDDIYDTGKTFTNVFEYCNDFKDIEVDCATLVAKEPVPDSLLYGYRLSTESVNYKKWVIFPWEKGIER